MGSPVVHFEVNGKDGKRLSEFYRQAFDWKMQWDDKNGYALAQTEAGRGIDGGVGASRDGKGMVTFYVEVPDPNAALKKIEGLGGKTIVPTTVMPMVTFALFSDPEGNVVGLVKSGT